MYAEVKHSEDCSSLTIIHCWVFSLLIPSPSSVLYSRRSWGCQVLTKLTEATLFHPAWYFHSYNQSDIVQILGNIYHELSWKYSRKPATSQPAVREPNSGCGWRVKGWAWSPGRGPRGRERGRGRRRTPGSSSPRAPSRSDSFTSSIFSSPGVCCRFCVCCQDIN